VTITFKITRRLFAAVQTDLLRRHAFAAERVGWLICRVGDAFDGNLIVLAHEYEPVADADYLDDPSVGAMMGPAAIRKALQIALSQRASMFHVHLHDHCSFPRFSATDVRETSKFVPDFWNVRPELPHGAVVLSRDAACGRCWYPGRGQQAIGEFVIVGAPQVRVSEAYEKQTRSPKLSQA
jgi:hypothetical protein